METKTPPHHTKPTSPLPSTTSPNYEGDRSKPRRAVRTFPLLLMTVYAATLLLWLSLSSSSFPINRTKSDRRSQDLESSSLKTHIISSRENSLRAGEREDTSTTPASNIPCSAFIDGTAPAISRGSDESLLCCDRTHFRTDVCYMRGDIRTDSRNSSIYVYGSARSSRPAPEKIRPYTRKWEEGIMSSIDELTLLARAVGGGQDDRTCEVRHEVPAVVFSTGGYTGNVYHEFSDGLVPLYVTSERFRGEVVLVVLEYHPWWFGKYGSVVRLMSNYHLVDFRRDRRVHCFPEVIVGLKIHGELTIDPHLMLSGKGMQDFRELLDQGFGGSKRRIRSPLIISNTTSSGCCNSRKPKLLILGRTGSRVLLNQKDIIRTSQRIGFQTRILYPRRGTPMPDLYDAISSVDAVVSVHGAAATHLLFMRPAAVLVQVVPLGLDRPAEEFYGRPARRLGLQYLEYRLLPEESSLLREYDRHDPVIADPTSVAGKGWPELKRVYLDHQNVKVNMRRFSKVLVKARSIICGKTQPTS